jgi:Ca2+-binding EF-hand superfamily protein
MDRSLFVTIMLFISGAAAADVSGFEAMDTDRDGKISPSEHAAAAARMFRAMDDNRNGKVTAAEMQAAQPKVTAKKVSKQDLSAEEKIKLVDGNGDGTLTAREHAVASETMFRKMDTDKDGSLSRAEFDAGHAALKK